MTAEGTMCQAPDATVTRAERTRNRNTYRPNVDILETADELLVVADMPGVCAEDADIRFENGTLTLHGRVCERQGEGTRHLLREYGVGDFYRTFEVSEAIDAGRIRGEHANGVLTLHLPKTEASKPRKITVQEAK